MAASESYPDDLLYNKEHDWARIEGDEAVLGITWYAHDALGELVHYEPPAVGATVTRDASYGEVESVKAVSDVIAPLFVCCADPPQTWPARIVSRCQLLNAGL